MPSTDIYVAKESFTTTIDGAPVVINKGVTRVRAGHPLLKGREAYFEPLTVQYDVEKATAAPEERRGAPAAPKTPPATETPEPKTGAHGSAGATPEASKTSADAK